MFPYPIMDGPSLVHFVFREVSSEVEREVAKRRCPSPTVIVMCPRNFVGLRGVFLNRENGRFTFRVSFYYFHYFHDDNYKNKDKDIHIEEEPHHPNFRIISDSDDPYECELAFRLMTSEDVELTIYDDEKCIDVECRVSIQEFRSTDDDDDDVEILRRAGKRLVRFVSDLLQLP